MPNDTPLVSCLMPSGNHPARVARAILCFQQQLWVNKELIVVDHGSGNIEPLLDDLPGNELRYIRYTDDISKKPGIIWNKALEHASGDFLIHWDPSDWYHPERIIHQVRPLLEGAKVSRTQSTLLHLDHPEYVHHPYADRLPGGYSGSMMYRKRDDIRYPERKSRTDHTFTSHWEEEEVVLLEPDFSWLIVRTLSGERRSREYKKFVAGYRNSTKDLALLAWVKLRGRNMVSHPRFRLSPPARESFSRYLKETKQFGLLDSVS